MINIILQIKRIKYLRDFDQVDHMKVADINYKNIYYPPGGILMWIIIFLELITFGIALLVMAYHSKEAKEIFHTSRLQLHTSIGAINTIFLIVSGYFMALSVNNFKKQNLQNTKLFLKLTMLGGLLFLGLKGFEYYYKIDEGLTIGYNTFYSFYWLLTGFHVIHVLVGLVILHAIFRKLNPHTSLEDIEASGAFWHMCDLIWLLLFPVIYLLF